MRRDGLKEAGRVQAVSRAPYLAVHDPFGDEINAQTILKRTRVSE